MKMLSILNRKILFISYLFIIFFPKICNGITISKIIETTIEKDPELKSCILEEKVQKKVLKEKKHNFWPNLNIFSSIGWYNNEISSSESINIPNLPTENNKETFFRNVGAILNWTIFKEKSFLGYKNTEILQVQEKIKEQKYNCEYIKLTKIQNNISIFLDIYFLQKKISLIKNYMNDFNHLFKIAQDKYKKGLISKLNLEYIKTIIDQSLIDIKIYKNAIEKDKTKIKEILNIKNDIFLKKEDLLKYNKICSISKKDLENIVNKNPELNKLKSNKNYYFLEYKKSKTHYWPELNLSSGIILYKDNEDQSKKLNYISLNLNFNFDLKNRDIVSENYYNYISYDYKIKNLKTDLFNEYLEKINYLKQLKLQISSLELEIKWKNLFLKKLNIQFDLGQIDILSLLDYKQEILELEKQILDLKKDFLNKNIDLYLEINISNKF